MGAGTKKSEQYIKFFIYLVVIILANVAGITFFIRADLTKNKLYSISAASKKVVSSLSEPLTINVFFTRNLPAPHNSTERYLHDLLEEYAVNNNKYFNYRFYNVSTEEGDISDEAIKNQELAQNYGIQPVQIQNIESDEVRLQKAYMGLVLIQGDIIEKIPTITTTEGLEYKLTTAIQKLNNKISTLVSLQGKIQVKLFLSSSLNIVAPYMQLDDMAWIAEKLETIINTLNEKTYGKLEYKHFDPSSNQQLKDEIKKYNIMTLKWPELADGSIKPGEGSVGLVLEYKDNALTIPLIQVLRMPLIGTQYNMVNMDEMEKIISENLESLIDINEDIGFLADHGTLPLYGTSRRNPMFQDHESLSNFKSQVSKNYSIKEVNLKDGPIPDSFNTLIIARPTERFSDYELFQIDQFLMKGKSLALFLEVFNEVAPQGQQFGFNQGPTYMPIDTGIGKLLEHYGVRVKRSYVLDESCYVDRMQANQGGGERVIYFAPIIKNNNINDELDFMKNIKGLITMKISPLELVEKRITENSLTAHRLFSSSDKSWEMGGRINLNPMMMRPPESDDEKQSMDLAYLIEGEFPSYFAGKPIPEQVVEEEKDMDENGDAADTEEAEEKKTDDKPAMDMSKIESGGEALDKGRHGKIMLIATGEILKNNMFDEEGQSPNAIFIMNALDSLNNRDDIAIMRSKVQRFNPLDDTDAGVKIFVKTFNIIGLPVLVIIFSLIIWMRRHSRKKRIQMMFKK